ncbi:hypothetical protein L596_028389 [Steinernema carpocapsae]|uniref:EGF-like domain-containing protein n=1 Tax=Steinernema carpocapsae TaxID=34508 RepID=A0A4U5LYB3_STECR|nr:hypothetical protein L596_028389 [Steinernema carpocapsae]
MDVGAKSIGQCILECQSGYRLDRVANQCRPCGYNHFQPSRGQSSCLKCPDGTVALTQTATTRSECLTKCGPGQQRKESTPGLCESCPRGTFKAEGDEVCQSCPEALTTSSTGATDIKYCNLPNCEPGSYLDPKKRQCEFCPLGEYQDLKGTTSCKSCKSGFTTKTIGTKDNVECVSTNQCTNGEHNCHWLAQCFDLPDLEGQSNYGCKCHPGFIGNGFTCVVDRRNACVKEDSSDGDAKSLRVR